MITVSDQAPPVGLDPTVRRPDLNLVIQIPLSDPVKVMVFTRIRDIILVDHRKNITHMKRLIFSYLSETNVYPASTSVPPALLQQRLSSRPSRVTRTTPAENFYQGWEPENSKN